MDYVICFIKDETRSLCFLMNVVGWAFRGHSPLINLLIIDRQDRFTDTESVSEGNSINSNLQKV